jgi:hypothetical protein
MPACAVVTVPPRATAAGTSAAELAAMRNALRCGVDLSRAPRPLPRSPEELHGWMRRNVRLRFRPGRIQPADAVLAEGEADCKGFAILGAAMGDALGWPAAEFSVVGREGADCFEHVVPVWRRGGRELVIDAQAERPGVFAPHSGALCEGTEMLLTRQARRAGMGALSPSKRYSVHVREHFREGGRVPVAEHWRRPDGMTEPGMFFGMRGMETTSNAGGIRGFLSMGLRSSHSRGSPGMRGFGGSPMWTFSDAEYQAALNVTFRPIGAARNIQPGLGGFNLGSVLKPFLQTAQGVFQQTAAQLSGQAGTSLAALLVPGGGVAAGIVAGTVNQTLAGGPVAGASGSVSLDQVADWISRAASLDGVVGIAPATGNKLYATEIQADAATIRKMPATPTAGADGLDDLISRWTVLLNGAANPWTRVRAAILIAAAQGEIAKRKAQEVTTPPVVIPQPVPQPVLVGGGGGGTIQPGNKGIPTWVWVAIGVIVLAGVTYVISKKRA